MKYISNIDLSNKNNSHTQVFDTIERFSEGRKLKILEVGCSSGYFGGALVDQGHEVWGVEPNQDAANAAAKILYFVYVGFIEDFFIKNSEKNFDVIIFGDVLEHLTDPSDILTQSKNFLSIGGIVVASIPNIAHFSVRAMLLEGRFEYSELGILDRTHLRFFTKNTIIELFHNSGYEVLGLSAVRLSVQQVDNMCGLNVRKESITNVKEFCTDMLGYDFQYVVTSCPCENFKEGLARNDQFKGDCGLRVLCLVNDCSSNLVDIRIRRPLKRWEYIYGGHVEVMNISDCDDSSLGWADVVVFHREVSKYVTRLAAFIQKIEKKVVFEIDDLLTNLPPFLSHHSTSVKKVLPCINKLLLSADAVSVSTDVLLNKFHSKNPNIFITPNFSEPIYQVAKHSSVSPENITLIVASSDKVLVDMLINPLKILQNKYRFKTIVIGPIGDLMKNCGLDIESFPVINHSDFKSFIASIDNGIGLIPLDSSEFSSAKTAVKYFDYSICGIPSVCSEVLPYSRVIDNEHSGLLVSNDSESWIKAIEGLLTSYERRSVLAKNARDEVIHKYNIDISAKSWNKLFDSLNVDVLKRENKKFSIATLKNTKSEVIFSLIPHLMRPRSYYNLVKALITYGVRGLYARLIKR